MNQYRLSVEGWPNGPIPIELGQDGQPGRELNTQKSQRLKLGNIAARDGPVLCPIYRQELALNECEMGQRPNGPTALSIL